MAIEVYPAMMNQIRVLIVKYAAGTKPNNPIGWIDGFDPANDPFALGDRILQSARLRIHKVKVPPSVALRGIDDFLRVLDPVDSRESHVLGVSGPNKRLRALVDWISSTASLS